jgi:hypothetical protein
MKLKAMLLSLLIASSTSFAVSPSKRFIENFFGHCVYSAPDFKRLVSIAETSNWKSLSEKELQLLGPIDNTAEFNGWHISSKDDDYYLSYTKGLVDNQIINTCAIYSSTWDELDVRGFLKGDGIAQKLIYHKKVGMQNYDTWIGKLNGFNTMLVMTTYDGLSGGTLSLAIKV